MELIVITSKIPDKNLTTESCVTKLFFPILMSLKNFSSWILTENTVIDFFCLTRSGSGTKTCNKFCLSFVYNVSFFEMTDISISSVFCMKSATSRNLWVAGHQFLCFTKWQVFFCFCGKVKDFRIILAISRVIMIGWFLYIFSEYSSHALSF